MFRRLILLAMGALLAACGRPEPWRQESYVFGTRVELAIAGAPEAKARAAASRVLRDFDYLHRTYHAWQPSQLSALNEAIAAGRSHEVTTEFAAYIREAQAVAAAGDHLFDPGIGRLIALWGFHTDDIQARLPDPGALKALVAQHPSIADLSVKEGPCPEPRSGEPKSPPSSGRRQGFAEHVSALPQPAGHAGPAVGRGAGGWCIRSRVNSVAIDFGGYLKGVALDRAAASLKADGIDNALINIGGNVLALGSRDGAGTPWRIGLQHPRPQSVGGAPLATLELKDGEAIGTSGDYHRYFEVEGRRYCHLLDPRTGFPAADTRAVTVLITPQPGVGALHTWDSASRAGMRSDALSKPIFIAGGEWRAMAKKLGVAAVLRVGADGTVSATPALHSRLKTDLADLKLEPVE